jgi:hypothetical protein
LHQEQQAAKKTRNSSLKKEQEASKQKTAKRSALNINKTATEREEATEKTLQGTRAQQHTLNYQKPR